MIKNVTKCEECVHCKVCKYAEDVMHISERHIFDAKDITFSLTCEEYQAPIEFTEDGMTIICPTDSYTPNYPYNPWDPQVTYLNANTIADGGVTVTKEDTVNE